jgi:hypothetical protein
VIGHSVWKLLPRARLEEVRCSKERVYVKGQHSCWRHCDFPSECLTPSKLLRLGTGNIPLASSRPRGQVVRSSKIRFLSYTGSLYMQTKKLRRWRPSHRTTRTKLGPKRSPA